MKKTVSLLLCLAILFSFASFAGAEETTTRQIDPAYPTIIVAGYSSSSLYLNTKDGRQKGFELELENE